MVHFSLLVLYSSFIMKYFFNRHPFAEGRQSHFEIFIETIFTNILKVFSLNFALNTRKSVHGLIKVDCDT